MTASEKRDFGTLATAHIARAGLARLEAATSAEESADALGEIILKAFDDYYFRSRQIPLHAKRAFERKDWPHAIELSRERIAIFSVSIDRIAPVLRQALDDHGPDRELWTKTAAGYRQNIAGRYEADLAVAYLNSVERRLFNTAWRPDPSSELKHDARPLPYISRLRVEGAITAQLVKKILSVPAIEAPFRDLEADAQKVAERINEELGLTPESQSNIVEVLDAGLYRNRGAYIVGALQIGEDRHPLALALLHRDQGVEVDAVILRQSTLAHVFSSTLANFHVTLPQYHEVVDFLHGLMPIRPHAEHYSTIGFNHVGKLAIARQIVDGLEAGGEKLDHAPGPRGSVAMGFTAPGIEFIGKVIRDHPTEHYKWDRFDGVGSILLKYRQVHELNRSGSMLDNIVYSNILLPETMFDPAFLQEMLDSAGQSVRRRDGEIQFDHLIVQRRLVPLPLYLETCAPDAAERAVIRLGQCIRNNASINVFNKDLDGRNYGVSALRFVYLFDYDAIERLTDVSVHTNLDRDFGEEDVPDWFFEDGIVFLPEEIEAHLRLPSRELRHLFRQAHGELLSVDYWLRMQEWLREGRVPTVRTYPRATQLDRAVEVANLTLSEQ